MIFDQYSILSAMVSGKLDRRIRFTPPPSVINSDGEVFYDICSPFNNDPKNAIDLSQYITNQYYDQFGRRVDMLTVRKVIEKFGATDAKIMITEMGMVPQALLETFYVKKAIILDMDDRLIVAGNDNAGTIDDILNLHPTRKELISKLADANLSVEYEGENTIIISRHKTQKV